MHIPTPNRLLRLIAPVSAGVPLAIIVQEQAVQHRKEGAYSVRLAGIIHHLPVAPGFDKIEGAQFGKMLRQCGLAELNLLGKDAD